METEEQPDPYTVLAENLETHRKIIFEGLSSLLTGQQELTRRLNEQGERLDRMEIRLAGLERRVDKIAARVDKIAARVDKIAARVDKIAAKVDKLNTKLDDIGKDAQRRLKRIETPLQLNGHLSPREKTATLILGKRRKKS